MKLGRIHVFMVADDDNLVVVSSEEEGSSSGEYLNASFIYDDDPRQVFSPPSFELFFSRDFIA